MDIVVGGHVDHGKSTIVGRLLADTHSLPDGKLEQVKALCARTARPFEYAFLIDALKDEQSQGITIDAARVFFKTTLRDYLIIDAPGHLEFLRNMVTGASRAEAALLVIDASEGLQDNSRRHGYMLSMLGVRHVTVLVNKMDLAGYDRAVFDRVEADYRAFLANLDIGSVSFIPVCGRTGENITAPAVAMPWYSGPTLLEALDDLPAQASEVARPFRMPVQDVYKFTSEGDDRRIVAGTVEAGTATVGDEVVFHPSGKKAVISSFEAFQRQPPSSVAAGQAIGFQLAEQIYVTRGEVACIAGEPGPHVTTRLRVSLFWLGRMPLTAGKDYLIRVGTARATMRVDEIHRVIDASTLASNDRKELVERHEVAECTLKLHRALAFDLAADSPRTSRFVIVDDFEISGGGIVREALPDRQTGVREKVLVRDARWEASAIPASRRASRFAQRPTLILITGPASTDRKVIAKRLEASLFDEGRAVYFLGIGNVLYGVDADMPHAREHRSEHMRRLAEITHLMLDAGMLLIVTAIELTQDDLELIQVVVGRDSIQTVWVGEPGAGSIAYDLLLTGTETEGAAVGRIRQLLQDKAIIGR
jgi:bifunctional enzyme CysN/CysC